MASVIYIRTADGVLLRFEDESKVSDWISDGKIGDRDFYLDENKKFRPLSERPVNEPVRLSDRERENLRQNSRAPAPVPAPVPAPSPVKVSPAPVLEDDDELFGSAPTAKILDPVHKVSQDEPFSRGGVVNPSENNDLWSSEGGSGFRHGGVGRFKWVIVFAVAVLVLVAVVLVLRGRSGDGADENTANALKASDMMEDGAKPAESGQVDVQESYDTHAAQDGGNENDLGADEVDVETGDDDVLEVVDAGVKAEAKPPSEEESETPKKQPVTVPWKRPVGQKGESAKEKAGTNPVREIAQPIKSEGKRPSVVTSNGGGFGRGEPALEVSVDGYEEHMQRGAEILNNDAAKALVHFQYAASKRPNRVEPVERMGYCSLKKGNLDAAAGHYRNALKIMNTHGPSIIGLARIYKIKGNVSDARYFYTRYLEVNPTGSQAKEAREYLEGN